MFLGRIAGTSCYLQNHASPRPLFTPNNDPISACGTTAPCQIWLRVALHHIWPITYGRLMHHYLSNQYARTPIKSPLMYVVPCHASPCCFWLIQINIHLVMHHQLSLYKRTLFPSTTYPFFSPTSMVTVKNVKDEAANLMAPSSSALSKVLEALTTRIARK